MTPLYSFTYGHRPNCDSKHTCDCLLDTGSEVTLIPASVVEDEVVKPSNHRLAAANGTEITVLGEVTLPLVLEIIVVLFLD